MFSRKMSDRLFVGFCLLVFSTTSACGTNGLLSTARSVNEQDSGNPGPRNHGPSPAFSELRSLDVVAPGTESELPTAAPPELKPPPVPELPPLPELPEPPELEKLAPPQLVEPPTLPPLPDGLTEPKGPEPQAETARGKNESDD